MAIDTRSKRASVLGVALIALTLPLADGTIAQADRQAVAFSYSGIAAIAGTVATADVIVRVRAQDITVQVPADDTVVRCCADDGSVTS